jgi:hypothetical protein
MDGKQQAIHTTENDDARININVKQLKPGMYLLRIGYQEGFVRRKFVVKR